MTFRPAIFTAVLAVALAGCVTRAIDVKPLPANPVDFARWDCTRIDDEIDRVQQRAVDLAYAVDERGANNIVALGLGLSIFWPALLAMRPDGPDAAELGRLRGRFEALRVASAFKACPPASSDLPPARAAGLPIQIGDRLVYEERLQQRGQVNEAILQVVALRRDEVEFRDGGTAVWRQDLAGNVVAAPPGSLLWPRLLRRDLELGQVLAGDVVLSGGDPLVRARVRGQVLAVGQQLVDGRRFDAAVIELYGDAQRNDTSTRLEGSMVVDRPSGLLLRLDLQSAHGEFTLQRRLARIEPGPAR
jgi:hypothetical protein